MGRHPVGTVVAAAVLVVVAGGLIDLLRIRAAVESGRDTLTGLSADQLNRDLVDTVGGAAGDLDHADAVADRSPFLSLIGVLPGASAQVEGLRGLTEAAADLGHSAERAVRTIDPDLQDAGGEPAARLRLLDALSTELDRVEGDAASIDLGPPLRGPLGRARDDLRSELDALPRRIADARERLHALERVLRGPTRYLVLAANNAEMRGGAGMPLSGGVLTIEDGDLDFGEFESTANRWAGPIPAGIVPAEYADTYHQFRMGTSWLQTAVSPNFEVLGPVYDAMSGAFPQFGPVDGVLVVDTVTLRHLLEVIGPVAVDGTEYSAANVERELLNESYLRFGADLGEREERQDAQGAVATAIFDALKSRDVDLAAVSSAMRDAAAGRHLLAYAEDETIQEMFTEIGADGALYPGSVMVTVQNISADKLDWYIDPSVAMRASQEPDTGIWDVRLSVRIPNPEREGDTAGVETYRDDYRRDHPPGIHRAMVAVYLPEAAFHIRAVDGDVTEAGADGPTWMVAQRVFIEEGAEEQVTFEFSLPPEHSGVLVLPSARVRPVTVTVNGAETDDAAIRFVSFLPPAPGDEVPGTTVTAALLAVVGAAALVVGARRRFQSRRPLVAPGALELRLPTLGMLLLVAAGATLVGAAVWEAVRPR